MVSAAQRDFNMCTFWLVEALTRLVGRAAAARASSAAIEHMLLLCERARTVRRANGPGGGALGNFPQAFTHLSLISAAFNLDRTLRP